MLHFVLYLIEVLKEQVMQKYVVHTLFLFIFVPIPGMCVRPTLMGTKNLYFENGPNPFLFLFFSILWEREWSRFVSQIRLSVS